MVFETEWQKALGGRGGRFEKLLIVFKHEKLERGSDKVLEVGNDLFSGLQTSAGGTRLRIGAEIVQSTEQVVYDQQLNPSDSSFMGIHRLDAKCS